MTTLVTTGIFCSSKLVLKWKTCMEQFCFIRYIRQFHKTTNYKRMAELTLFKTLLQIRQKSREASSRQRDRLPCFIGVSLTDLINFPLTEKVSKYGVISGPYLPAFGLNTERYFGFLGIQSECGEIRTRNKSVFGLFTQCSCNGSEPV